MRVPFGEVLILTNCNSPHRKHELFAKAKYPTLFYQDDDCLSPVFELYRNAKPDIINCVMKPFHLEKYKNSRIALLGWGSLFPKTATHALSKYRSVYGEDFIYRRETERIMTWFNYPQNRLELPIIDLQSAWAPDRLSNQPGHYDYIPVVEQRCAEIEALELTSSR